ncbi:sulfite exporter TauE/SafE family protein [Rhodobacter sp. Har01]|uniref:sulfite exporter TauE/SafE family protein n=1 Tax=Rhodobacter sp. Har01 TaxID=2883999 RepID=UPI001D0750BC|nr:sulfite exporter TauE/SafE family protein [Rhodobacter sp. Har01]MCB6176789.1 sulfite exporter TauE/SafE family protein [Rhodobacter sp. Har01]
MPFDLGLGASLWMGVAVLVAAFIRGYSGFGYSALVISASGLVTNPLNLVAVVVVLEMVMSAQAWKGAGHAVDWHRVGWLMAGAVIGLPLGLWALTAISEDAARAVIAAYVLVMCGVLMAGWRMRSEVRGPVNGAMGVISGVANAPGMAGLPVVAFFAAQPMQPAVFRATLIAYFPILDLYSAPLYWIYGLVSWDTLKAAAVALPLTVLGNWLGGRHFFGTDPQEFRRFAILLLAGLAALGLGKALL